jgi:hypothetical protein
MQYAPTTSAPSGLPTTLPGGVTAGIDWASTDHVACVVDQQGRVTARFTVTHTSAGLTELVRQLRRAGAGEVAIERSDGPLVEALLAAELTVVVVSPNQLKNLRSRYGSAGNEDDRFDAYVLADTLRTDRHRLRPLTPDSPATQTLRATVRARRDLVAHRVALGATSCARTCSASSPARSACSASSTPRSAWLTSSSHRPGSTRTDTPDEDRGHSSSPPEPRPIARPFDPSVPAARVRVVGVCR